MASDDELRKYREAYPNKLAFSDDGETQLTRDERSFEFELEKLIDRINDTVTLRQDTYRSPDAKTGLPQPVNLKTIYEHRADRNKFLSEISKPPEPQEPDALPELLFKEVSFAEEPKNVPPFVLTKLIAFYEHRLEMLPLRRYKLLYRWARHCDSSELLSRSDALLGSRLTRIAEDMTHTEQTLQRLLDIQRGMVESRRAGASPPPADATPADATASLPPTTDTVGASDVSQSEAGEAGLDGPGPVAASKVAPADIWVWLNDTCFRDRMRRRFGRFTTKCKWAAVSKRWELYQPIAEVLLKEEGRPRGGDSDAHQAGHISLSADPSGAETAKQHVPLLALTEEDVEPLLDELTTCFRLKGSGDDSQEYTYSVNKRFASVFAAQNKALEFAPYELAGAKAQARGGDGKGNAANAAQAEEDEGGVKVCFVHATWLAKEMKHSAPPLYVEAMRSRLNNNQDYIDGSLQVEAKFLRETDTQHVIKRLREQAATHVERALVKHTTEADARGKKGTDRFGTAGKATGVGVPQGGPPLHKRQALYLLRYIRIREFRRRLLDMMNYYSSLRRRLCLDQHGYPQEGGKGGETRSGLREAGLKKRNPAVYETLVETARRESVSADSRVEDDFVARIKQFTLHPDGLTSGKGDELDERDGHASHAGGDALGVRDMLSIENRDDVYRVSGKSITVVDRFGQAIMYDTAVQNLDELEGELLKIGTHYLTARTPETSGAADIDRVAILEDLYECETWYQEGKRKVIDCYMEAYEHARDREEQEKLAQLITDCIHARPMLNLADPYFAQSYTSETIVHELHYSLLRDVISVQISDEKRAVAAIYKGSNTGDRGWWTHAGLPDRTSSDTKLFQPLFPGSSVVNVLDFYGSLPCIANVHGLIENATTTIIERFDAGPRLVNTVKQQVLQQFIVEWKILLEEERIQRQLHAADVVDDVDDRSFLDDSETIHQIIESIALDAAKSTKKGQKEPKIDQVLVTNLWYDAMEAVTARSMLLDSVYETELLYNVHRKQGMVMGVGVKKFEFEAMDFETRKAAAEIDEINEIEVDMSEVASYKSEYLTSLAVAEFERHLGQFDFHSYEGVKKILSYRLADLRRAHTVQVVQKNILIAAALYNQLPIDSYYESLTYQRWKERDGRAGGHAQQAHDAPENSTAKEEPDRKITTSKYATATIQGTKREPPQAAVAQDTARIGPHAFPPHVTENFLSPTQLQSLFLSVNHLKTMHRRTILEELNARTSEVLRSKRPEHLRKKMTELKHALIDEYCLKIMLAVLPYAYRWQAARISNDIRRECAHTPGFEPAAGLMTFGASHDDIELVASGTSQGRNKGEHWQGTCLVALDGRVEEPWYIPHYYQVYTKCLWGFADTKIATQTIPGIGMSGIPFTTDLHVNMRTAVCMRSMVEILHYSHGLLAVAKSMSKLSYTASVAADPRGGLEHAAKEFKAIQHDMDQVADLSDMPSVVAWLRCTYTAQYLKLYLALSAVRVLCMSPGAAGRAVALPSGHGEKDAFVMKHTADIMAAALKRVGEANVKAVLPTDTAVDTPLLSAAQELRQEKHPRGFCHIWHLLMTYELDAPEEEVHANLGRQGPYVEGFYDALAAKADGWVGAERPGMAWLQCMLLGAGDQDRKQVLTEYGTISAQTAEVKSDAALDTVAKDEADVQLRMVHAVVAALRVYVQREKLKVFYCGKLRLLTQLGVDVGGDKARSKEAVLDILCESGDAVRVDDHFLNMINTKTRLLYEQELQEQDEDAVGVGARAAKANSTRGRGRGRPRTDIGLRKKQVQVLRQEVNKVLLNAAILSHKELLDRLTKSVMSLLKDGDVRLPEPGASQPDKLDMFNAFHTLIMTRAVATRADDSEAVVYKVPGTLLSAAVDQLGASLRDWQVQNLKGLSDCYATTIQQHRHVLFTAEQKIAHLERLRELDKKAMTRRVAACVNDEKYALIYQKNSIQKESKDLQHRLSNLETIVRDRVKSEYDDMLGRLQDEISLLKLQFKDHKKKLYREMRVNLEEIKRHAMMSIGKSEVAPLHMKRQALRIAINDEETNKLKEQNAELQMTVVKLKLWHNMKTAKMEAEFQKKLAALEKDKEEASSKYWGNKEQVEEREVLMRQQLIATQKSLSATEMEVEQLLRDLELQERKKKHLVTWKVTHAKQLEELTRKAKRYEKYERHDVALEKLLKTLEKGEVPATLASPSGRSSVAQAPVGHVPQSPAVGREVVRLREELKREKRLKTKAFLKLDQIRQDAETVADEMVWQRKYFECASELQGTLNELQVFKDYLTANGIAPPNFKPPESATLAPHPSKNLPTLSPSAGHGSATDGYRTPPPARVGSAPPPEGAARPRVVPTRPSTTTPTRVVRGGGLS
eukprot:TRINITY_DN29972_c0_g1_i1.p1 TRINITY_DN29972_c0_g1~~TRINITY_DN29972_c0_g1_i1.p1  ORF type:complete len:2362 (+),score=833.90 TRINITY_DN29972_c0_g1_i1:111-7196(+)